MVAGPEPRALAKRVAKVLRDKGKSAEAVPVPSAWAAAGAEGAGGQAPPAGGPGDELARLDREGRPVFQRAQVGFNNNVRYKSKHYHVQTEDSGLGNPHVITHVFADGGRIIKSHKRTYADAVSRDDVVTHVRALMKGQHMEMVGLLQS